MLHQVGVSFDLCYSYITVLRAVQASSITMKKKKMMMMKAISEFGNTCFSKTGEQPALSRSFKRNSVSLYSPKSVYICRVFVLCGLNN